MRQLDVKALKRACPQDFDQAEGAWACEGRAAYANLVGYVADALAREGAADGWPEKVQAALDALATTAFPAPGAIRAPIALRNGCRMLIREVLRRSAHDWSHMEAAIQHLGRVVRASRPIPSAEDEPRWLDADLQEWLEQPPRLAAEVVELRPRR